MLKNLTGRSEDCEYVRLWQQFSALSPIERKAVLGYIESLVSIRLDVSGEARSNVLDIQNYAIRRSHSLRPETTHGEAKCDSR